MSAQVHVLASGSTGNATYVALGGAKVLVDAGISARRIQKGLESIGVAVSELDAVVLTHEHRDHVLGLGTLTRRHGVPVYARPAAWQAMKGKDKMEASCCRDLPERLHIGGVDIHTFPISHDAADPVGFNFFHHDVKCSVATDLGFATETVVRALAYSDILVLEANHDVNMLEGGSYPWHLKQRILSNRGHLSNDAAAWLLAKLPKKKQTEVFLAHLRQENNRPQLALETVETILRSQSVGEEENNIRLLLTYPDQMTSL